MRATELGAVALLALGASACNFDVCTEHPPAFELEIRVSDDVDVPVASFDVRVFWEDQRFTRHFVVGDKLDDELTSVGVELVPPPTEEVDVRVEVIGHATEDPDSPIVARDDENFELSPDGCNLVMIGIDPIDD